MKNNNIKTKFIFLLIIFFGFFGLAQSSQAAEYYVSPTGSDSNPGTIGQPWQHIAYATCGGSYASVMGAYITGNEVIGYTAPESSDTTPPASPTGLTVQ